MKKSILLFVILLSCGLSFAQKDGYKPVESQADFDGVWITSDSSRMQLFEDEFAPGGKWLIIYDSKSYFSEYIDPDYGATMDVEFIYTLKSNKFDCKLIGSNSLGYFMQNENQPFSFKLYYKIVENEHYLRLVNDFGTTYELVHYTED